MPFSERRTPKQARSRATVEAIVEAAAQILERRGPEGFTTADVAERAGVSIGSLYQYFPDKQALLIAAARRDLAEAPPRRRALMAALIDLVERLGAAPASTGTGKIAKPLRRRPDWRAQSSELLEHLIDALAPPAPALIPIPVHARTRR